MNWHEPDDVPSDVLNKILWWDAKGVRSNRIRSWPGGTRV